jgi:hypothetical protein
MAIHPTNSNTQKGLLGYLLQGNTRLLVAKPLQGSEGRIKFRARAVARLLMVSHTPTHQHVPTRKHTHKYVHIHTERHTHRHTHTRTNTHTHTRTNTHTHTHTHTEHHIFSNRSHTVVHSSTCILFQSLHLPLSHHSSTFVECLSC